MNVLVVGLGSMGRRRIRLLKSFDPHIRIYGIDTQAQRRAQTETELGVETISDYHEALQKIQPAIVFACTSPLAHTDIVCRALEHHCHTFSELNLQKKGYEQIIALSEKKGKIAFLSSTMLYRKEIQWLKNAIKPDQNYTYRYHVGQYLPDWHPWENYTDFFAARPETNGCRELMAIEFPWLMSTFGPVKRFFVLKNRLSLLKIDFPDTFQILLQHENGTMGNVSIDLIARKALRRLEIYSEADHFFWNGTHDSLSYFSPENKQELSVTLYDTVVKKEGYADFILENAYLEEIRTFFDIIEKKEPQGYSYREDLAILELIDLLETREIG